MDNRYFFYKIFGIEVKSDVPIQELPLANKFNSTHSPFTFTVSRKFFSVPKISWHHHWKMPDGRTNLSCGSADHDYWLHFPGVAYFNISELRHITCYPYGDTTASIINHLLIDQVIPRLICHSGSTVLHGSCVFTNMQAICFLGPSKAGKSSLATFFHQQGHFLLSDDSILLMSEENDLLCKPGYIGLRLWDDSFVYLGPTYDHCEDMSHCCNKKRLSFKMLQDKEPAPYPIRNIFILKKTNANSYNTTIKLMKGSEAVIELVKNTLPLDITDKKYTLSSFKNLSRIVQSEFLSVYELSYPHVFSLLPSVYESIMSLLTSKSCNTTL